MISLADARGLIAAKIAPSLAQSVPLGQAAGHILREDLGAPEDLPAFDRSAMDGYAVGLEDDSQQFRLVGEVQPGRVPEFTIRTGEAARIFTGAQIPAGASQVIMQEQVRVAGAFITPSQRDRVTNIRQRGEDARQGDLLLKAGSRLGVGELTLLASLGVVRPMVSPAVRVVHFATGNELVEPSESPKPGQIRDSNSTLVAAFVRQFGGELGQQERVADDFDRLLARIRSAGAAFDLLLVSGGASVGDYDFGKKLLTALGFQIHFTALNLRPGKPLVFATRGPQAAFILPGNPVSHFVTLHAAVRLALDAFAGAKSPWPLVKMRLAEPFEHHPDGRETFWPARVSANNGELVAQALHWQSSGDVTGLNGANALLQLAGGVSAPKAGEAVPVLLLDIP